MIWAVLLLLVSLGILIFVGVVETRHGVRAALLPALLGLVGLLWAFYLYGGVILPFLFLTNT